MQPRGIAHEARHERRWAAAEALDAVEAAIGAARGIVAAVEEDGAVADGEAEGFGQRAGAGGGFAKTLNMRGTGFPYLWF